MQQKPEGQPWGNEMGTDPELSRDMWVGPENKDRLSVMDAQPERLRRTPVLVRGLYQAGGDQRPVMDMTYR